MTNVDAFVRGVHHAYIATMNGVSMSRARLHNMMGHCGKDFIQATAKAVGIDWSKPVTLCAGVATRPVFSS